MDLCLPASSQPRQCYISSTGKTKLIYSNTHFRVYIDVEVSHGTPFIDFHNKLDTLVWRDLTDRRCFCRLFRCWQEQIYRHNTHANRTFLCSFRCSNPVCRVRRSYQCLDTGTSSRYPGSGGWRDCRIAVIPVLYNEGLSIRLAYYRFHCTG